MKKFDQGQFIDQSVDDPFERVIVWAYNVYADAEQWDAVIDTKWRLLDHYQRGGK
jgi:hypothetical protein